MFVKTKPALKQRTIKEALLAAREEKGLSPEELAEIVCLKGWHIKELEQEETFRTFYSMAIKIQAAKKIGAYLGLSEEQYLETQE